MTDLQEKLLSLLLEIDHVCQDNGIEFYLAAGTALGAVRHKGFIPWDDDADIYMTNENWEKFYSVKDQLPEGRKLVTSEEDYVCGYVINRYVDLTSTKLYRYLCASPQDSGTTIDILVLDPVPDTPEDIQTYVTNLMEYCNVLTPASTHTGRCQYPLNNAEIYKKVKELGREKVLDELKERTRIYRGTTEGVLIQRDPLVPHVYTRHAFGKPQYVPFEYTKMPVAENIVEQLAEAYNEEWMYVPSEVDRDQHIKNTILDISNNNPFGEYLRHVNRDRIQSLYYEYQEKSNMLGDLQKQMNWERNYFSEARIKVHYRQVGFDFDALMEQLRQRDHEALDDYFKDYHTVQTDPAFIGSASVGHWLRSKQRYFVDMGDDFLYLYLRNLLHTNRLSAANKILVSREEKGEVSERLAALRDLFEAIRDGAIHMEKERYEEALKLTAPMHEQYPENLQILHIYFGAKYALADSPEEIKAVVDEISRLPECDQEDSVLMAIRADVFWKKGQYRKAGEIYDQLIETSTHGLVLNSIKERFEQYIAEHDKLPEMHEEEDLYEKILWRLGYISRPEEEE